MDLADLSAIVIVIVCIIGIPVAVVIHEINETPFDKCLDSCMTERLVGEVRLECNAMCVDKFVNCVEDVE